MKDKEFIQIAIKFLKYSFKDIQFTYQYLSGKERELITEDEFNLLIKYLNEN